MAPVVVVLVPVLARPWRVQPLADSLEGSTYVPTVAWFMASESDHDEIDAVREHRRSTPDSRNGLIVCAWEPGAGDYARKINLGARQAREQGATFVLMGADDLSFHSGWAEAAIARHYKAGGVCVVGTNDLGNNRVTSGQHATHPLVHLDYLDSGTIDEPGKLLHEGYCHNFVDQEFIDTARARDTWSPCLDSYVEHLHHLWGKSDDDATYRFGADTFYRDQTTYNERKHLWA